MAGYHEVVVTDSDKLCGSPYSFSGVAFASCYGVQGEAGCEAESGGANPV